LINFNKQTLTNSKYLLTLNYMKNNHNSSNQTSPIAGGGAPNLTVILDAPSVISDTSSVIPAQAGIHTNHFRLPRLHLFVKLTAMTSFIILTLAFIGLSTITFPTQQAQAATSSLCGLSSGSAPVVTATTVTYGGKKFDIIGYNKNGNEIGVAGPNNSVTLLLDKDASYTKIRWNAVVVLGSSIFVDSTISGALNTFANSTLTTNAGIIERTLLGGSNSYDSGDLSNGYNEDWIRGSGVTNQKVWALSVDEASHVILSSRIFNEYWWLRSPGNLASTAAITYANGNVRPNGIHTYDYNYAVRPALYLNISSPIFSSLSFDINLPIGACAPQPNNFGIDYVAETVTGLDNDIQGWSLADSYAGLTTPTQTTATPINISSNIGSTASTLYYVKATTNPNLYFNSNSDSNGVAKLNAVEGFSKLTIPARPAGPSVTGIAPSDVGVSDGKITGTSNKMEYSTDEFSWTSVTGAVITGLTSGTYFVRTVADQSAKKFKSFATEVIVPAGSSPSAGKPGSGTGPSAGDDGFSSEGTAQTGVDLVGLGLLLVLMLFGIVVLRRPATQPEIATLRSQ
jgi:hypothetical protein